MLNVHIITLFPTMFDAFTQQGVIGRAIQRDLARITFINPRDFADNTYRSIDDRPYGGGPGMVMCYQPLKAAIEFSQSQLPNNSPVIYLSPQGKTLSQTAITHHFVPYTSLILLCGRYEGIDERIIEHYVTQEWSIGDYVVSGGELPAMILLDAIMRLHPQVLGDDLSAHQDSFMERGLLDYPHYTRPECIDNLSVPDVLLSGHHADIQRWRLQQALGKTWEKRPELLESITLTTQEKQLLDEYKRK